MSAQRSPTHSSPGSGDDQDFNSDCGGRSQPDNPPSLRATVFNPFAGVFTKAFGNTFSKGVAPESTNAVSTTGHSGSRSSATWFSRTTYRTRRPPPPCGAPTNLGTRRQGWCNRRWSKTSPTPRPTPEPTPGQADGGVQFSQGNGPPHPPGSNPGGSDGGGRGWKP